MKLIHVWEFCYKTVITGHCEYNTYISITGTNKIVLIQNVFQFCTNTLTYGEIVKCPIIIVSFVYLLKYLQTQNSVNTW